MTRKATPGTKKRVHLVDLADHLGLAFGGHIVWLIFLLLKLTFLSFWMNCFIIYYS